MKEYLEKSSKILDELQTTEQGLSEAEAARRLSEHGPNRLAAGKKKSNLQRFFEELKDPMILILLAAALISGITSAYEGESYADVVIILTVVIINAVLGVLQESKAEKAIEALQEIAAATSKVMRGGKMEVKKSEELVPGDIVILEAGDAVPADGRILESASMKIDPLDLRERFRDRCIRLPMIDEARSLNLSNTVAVCVYEALRQNDFPGLLGVGEMAKTP